MSPAGRTAALLATQDVEELLEHRDALGVLSGPDVVELSAVLRVWADERAVGNVLMHADLLPDDVAWPAVLRGLAGGGWPCLGATVGARLLSSGQTSGPHRTALVAALLGAVDVGGPTTSASAAVALAELAGPEDADALVSLASRRTGTVRHNLLAAALEAAGRSGVAGVLEELVASETVDAGAAAGLLAEATADGAALPLLPALDEAGDQPS